MNLRRRIERLESEQPTVRCEMCRDWPDSRVAYSDPPPDFHPENQPPAVCPACGWPPIISRSSMSIRRLHRGADRRPKEFRPC